MLTRRLAVPLRSHVHGLPWSPPSSASTSHRSLQPAQSLLRLLRDRVRVCPCGRLFARDPRSLPQPTRPSSSPPPPHCSLPHSTLVLAALHPELLSFTLLAGFYCGCHVLCSRGLLVFYFLFPPAPFGPLSCTPRLRVIGLLALVHVLHRKPWLLLLYVVLHTQGCYYSQRFEWTLPLVR